MSVNPASGVGSAARSTQVLATETATRVTPGAATFKEVMGASASALLRGAAGAVRALPASPIVAASVRPMTAGNAFASPVAGASAEGLGGVAAAGGTNAAGSGVEAALSQSQDMNLYFIELQERLAAENRAFTTYSNVLKARHDTVKNAIGNIR